MSYPESSLALWLGFLVQRFLEEKDLGLLAGADGAMRLMPGLVRIPRHVVRVLESAAETGSA